MANDTNQNILSKIDADDKTLKDVLHEQKYNIDYFQREYRWERKHVEQLITDLEAAFLGSYDKKHKRAEVENYNSYYLGPIVICSKGSAFSVIDGQQRLTSLTLLLIHINNLQKKWGANAINIESLVRSEKFGKYSYNIQIDERKECLDALFETGEFDASKKEESVKNLVERYNDIEELFPEQLNNEETLPFFIDWLKEKVVFVKITAYSDENAYTIFETMNDRGLNLTPTEMLKGYLLSKVPRNDTAALNDRWRSNVSLLHELNKQEDLEFFRAWLRGKYAETIRPGSKGASNEDFEKIGTSFHTWVKDKTELIGLNRDTDFVDFIENKFDFYVKIYTGIWSTAQTKLHEGLEHIFYLNYLNHGGIASSLSFPLMLAPINTKDNEEAIRKKLNLTARFIETLAIYKAVNYRTLSQSSHRYSIYSLVKEVRDKPVSELVKIYKQRIRELDADLTGIADFALHQQNRNVIKFLLARMSSYIEKYSDMQSIFDQYMSDSYQVEHIWENHYERFRDEFDQEKDFDFHRNKIGGLLLLSKSINPALNDEPYAKKLDSYYGQNSILAKSLHANCYKKNPQFLGFIEKSKLPFKAHKQFKKKDLIERTDLYQKICERIWDLSGFDEISES